MLTLPPFCFRCQRTMLSREGGGEEGGVITGTAVMRRGVFPGRFGRAEREG